jgi:hypothetical protein
VSEGVIEKESIRVAPWQLEWTILFSMKLRPQADAMPKLHSIGKTYCRYKERESYGHEITWIYARVAWFEACFTYEK